MSSFTFSNAKVKLPYDTQTNWNNSTRILLAGEIVIATVSGTSKVMIKIGDGSHTFKQLPDGLYAKASDVINACKSESSLKTFINNLINPVKSVANAAKADVDTLKGSDNNKSARTIASEEIAKIIADAPESFDTLKEIADWISNHQDDAAAMNSAIIKLENILDGIGGEGESATVVQYVTDAINALNIGDYAKAADLTTLASRVSSLESTSHTHSNKTELDKIVEGDKDKWDTVTNKVDKVTGKDLSTNDFTNEYKIKLDGIELGANKTIVDSEFSDTSTNPVENKVIAAALGDIDTALDRIIEIQNSFIRGNQ